MTQFERRTWRRNITIYDMHPANVDKFIWYVEENAPADTFSSSSQFTKLIRHLNSEGTLRHTQREIIVKKLGPLCEWLREVLHLKSLHLEHVQSSQTDTVSYHPHTIDNNWNTR